MDTIHEGGDQSSVLSYSHVPVRLHNKEQILLSLRNLLYYPSVSSSPVVSTTYKNIIGALEQDATWCDFSYDKHHNQIRCLFGVSCGDRDISVMTLETTLLSTQEPISLLSGGSSHFNFGPLHTEFRDSFDSLSADSGFYDMILYKQRRESPFTEHIGPLKKLFASGFLYTLYDTKRLNSALAENFPVSGVVEQTKLSLIDAFNESPSLQGAYLGGGSRYYKYGVQEMGPYKQAVDNEQYLLEKMNHIRKNTVSLCCGTNYELDSKIVNKMLSLQKALFIVCPALAVGSIHLITASLGKAIDIMPFYAIAYAWSYFLYRALPLFRKTTYLGIDTDRSSTAYITEKLEENKRFRSVNAVTADIFDFLSGEHGDRLSELSGEKTFSMIGGTYGNFDHHERTRLVTLLQETMSVQDNILITFFNKPTTRQQKEQHVALYDNAYQRTRTSDYLHNVGFPVGSFILKYVYNDETDAVETYMCMQSTQTLQGNVTTKVYEQYKEYLVHSSSRLSLEDIQKDFGYGFVLEEYAFSEDTLQGTIILKKRV